MLSLTRLAIQIVFQRQSHKQNLSSCVVDAKEDIERHYTGDNLRQLFQYKEAACEVRWASPFANMR